MSDVVETGPEALYEALGDLFAMRGDEALVAAARTLVSGLATSRRTQPARTYDLTARPHVSWSQVLQALVDDINTAAIGAATGSLLLRAGGVSRPDGSLVALCGPSGSGKSTVTARLVQGGAAYVTDETLCLAPDSLRATPFRTPLAIRAGSQRLLPELEPAWTTLADRAAGAAWMVAPAALGSTDLPEAVLTPELLVFSTYRAGAAVQVERIEPSEAAYLLGRESSMLDQVRGGPLPALARLARRAPAYRLVHSHVDAAADRVRELWEAA